MFETRKRAIKRVAQRSREIDSLYRTLTLMLGCEYLLAVICSAASGLLPFMGIWVIVPLGALAMVALPALFLLPADHAKHG